MSEQVRGDVMSARSEEVRKISEKTRLNYMKSMIGKHQRVLIEKVSDNLIARGYGQHYLPVEFKVEHPEENRFDNVRITGIKNYEDPILYGEKVEG